MILNLVIVNNIIEYLDDNIDIINFLKVSKDLYKFRDVVVYECYPIRYLAYCLSPEERLKKQYRKEMDIKCQVISKEKEKEFNKMADRWRTVYFNDPYSKELKHLKKQLDLISKADKKELEKREKEKNKFKVRGALPVVLPKTLPKRYRSIKISSEFQRKSFEKILGSNYHPEGLEIQGLSFESFKAEKSVLSGGLLAALRNLLTLTVVGGSLDCKQFPESLTRLGLNTIYKFKKNSLPKNLEILEIYCAFDSNFDWECLPSGLRVLRILAAGPGFHLSVGNLKAPLELLEIKSQDKRYPKVSFDTGILSTTLKYLSLHGIIIDSYHISLFASLTSLESIQIKGNFGFADDKLSLDKIVVRQGMLPDSLKYLSFRIGSPIPVSFGECLPRSLEKMTILLSQKIERGIEPGSLPGHLRELELLSYQCPLIPGSLPSSLEHLKLMGFDHSLSQLPPGLKSLTLSNNYHQIIAKGTLPEGLLQLRFEQYAYVNQATKRFPLIEYLPESLEELKIDSFEERNGYKIENQKNLKKLVSLEKTHFDGDKLPSSLKSFEGQDIKPVASLPEGLEELILHSPSTTDLFSNQFPNSLKSLKLTLNHSIKKDYFPHNLKELEISTKGPLFKIEPNSFNEGLEVLKLNFSAETVLQNDYNLPSTLSRIYINKSHYYQFKSNLPFYTYQILGNK